MLKQSEAIVLRSYPLREADLLVSFFTRQEGKLRGVARAAKKSKKRFGGSLEPLTRVTLYYEDRTGHDLARLDSCDVLESPLAEEIFRAPVESFTGSAWPRSRGADLRKFLAQCIERHVEKKLVTFSMLDKIE